MAVVLQVRGSNGCGKTTAIRQIISKKNFRRAYNEEIGFYYYTDKSTVVIGDYETSNCAGVDRIRSTKQLQEIVEFLLDVMKPDALLFEGFICSKLVSFTIKLRAVCTKRGYAYKCAQLIVPFDLAYNRTVERTGRELKLEKFYGSWRSCLTAGRSLLERGVDISFIDVSNINKSEIGDAVLEVLGEQPANA